MPRRRIHDASGFDPKLPPIHLTGSEPGVSSTSQLSNQTTINNPFSYMDRQVWEWFLNRGLFHLARALGEASGYVADSFEVERDELRIHFSFHGRQRYAIVIRIPVRGEGSQRQETMEELENELYRSLREVLDRSQELEWLEDEVSLAFLPG